MAGQAFVTVATQDEYAIGGVVLGESLRRTGTSVELVILITEDVSLYVRQLLSDVYDHVYLTTELCSHDDVTLSLLGRPELGVTFTKLHCWRLTQYRKCVFLDADTLVLQSCDELFERDELSAVPDTGWPDCFNSGVFVFRPSLETYARLVTLATSKGSFDGGDQGLLNTYFGDWHKDMSKRLPFVYNVVATTSYTYAPAYKHHSSGVKIVHFLGSEKPWSVPWFTESGNVRLHHQHPLDMNVPVMQMWMSLFREKVLPKLPNIAQEEVKGQTEMTVSFLLQVIVGGKTRQYETPQQWMQWQQADHLLQEYFPAQAQQFVEHYQTQPAVHISHDERHRSQDDNHQKEKATHHYDDQHQHQHHHEHQEHHHGQQEHHDSHHEHHKDHQEHHEHHQEHHQGQHQEHHQEQHHEQHQEHHQEERHHHEEEHHQHGQEQHHDHHHWESKSQHESYQSQQDYQDQHWESASQWENPSIQHQESHQIQPEYQEPSDPHWEALLWHQIQNPWEPPSPPATDIYPPDPPYQQPDEPKEPTFGWFGSGDGGATSVLSASPSTGDYSVQQPPSSADTIKPDLDYETLPENEDDDVADDATLVASQPSETEEESFQRMKSWEEGHIDYMGRDNFDNIWKRLESMFRVEEPEVEEDDRDDDEEAKTDIQEAISEAAEIASEITEYFSAVSHLEGSQPESVYVDAREEVASMIASEASLPYPEGDFSGMLEWQEGRIDYSGKDRSDNIIKRLDMIFSGKLVLNN